jgi:hypothetical protein
MELQKLSCWICLRLQPERYHVTLLCRLYNLKYNTVVISADGTCVSRAEGRDVLN